MGVMRVAFSPDGKTLATGAFDGSVKLWSLTAEQEVVTLSVPRGGIFRSLAFSPDGSTLAVGYLHPPKERVTLFHAPSFETIAEAEKDRERTFQQ